jgi:hypothetical protein
LLLRKEENVYTLLAGEMNRRGGAAQGLIFINDFVSLGKSALETDRL